MKPTKKAIENKRKVWSVIAKQNGWFKLPFFVQVWHDKKGNIINSVSFKGLNKDIIEQVE